MTVKTEIQDPEVQKLILGVLESQLGKGKPDKLSNYTFHCPVCKHKKPKLVVNIKTGVYNCWTCHPATKGRTPVSLLKKISAPSSSIIEMKQYFGMKTTKEDVEQKSTIVELPKEFMPISFSNNDLYEKRVLSYLRKRGIDEQDILKYQIGYCMKGRYRDRVIIPSYDANGKLNYFVARALDSNTKPTYDAPSVKKTDIIGFEHHVNFNTPVVLCEGAFDAIAIKRNAIPLFGKTIPKSLMMKLVQSQVKTIYLALDRDALKESYAYAEELLNMGKEVYFLNMEDKDPSQLGFKKMVEMLQSAKPLTSQDLFFKKMQMVLYRA